MPIYSALAYFAILAVLLLYANSFVFSAADLVWHDETQRTSTLDGLRGFLATGVFFHHAAIYYGYLRYASWQLPPSLFFIQAGQSAVSLFFMITGYLFWGKAIRARGRLAWKPLYIGRVFRIAPLYFLAILLMLVLVFRHTHFILWQSPLTLFKQIAPLFFLGFYNPASVINTYRDPGLILAGVTWTLHFEWLFYLLLLPASAFLLRLRIGALGIALTGLIVSIAAITHTHSSSWIAATDFFTGMVCASLQQPTTSPYPRIHDRIKSALVISVMMLLVTKFDTAYAALPIALLGVVFLLITSGCTVFGLLRTRAARRLGEISYGIYILQGPVLYATFHFASVQGFALTSSLHYWLVITLAAFLLLSFALFAHRLLELPGIDLGRKLIHNLGRHNAVKNATAP